MGHEADWTQNGIPPLRDHRPGIPVSLRHYPAGAAIGSVHEDGALEAPKVNGKHTFGDWQSWRFWPATGIGGAGAETTGLRYAAGERAAPGPSAGPGGGSRGFGSWAPIFPAVVTRRVGTESSEDGFHPPTASGGVVRRVSFDPIANEGCKGDERYDARPWRVPGFLSTPPVGMLFVATAGMVEGRQAEVHLQADGRIICPGQNGLGHMASLVCDLEPVGVIATGSSPDYGEPGYAGRMARISTAFRVLRLGAVNGVPARAGNAVALQFSTTDQEGMLGYGCVYGLMDAGGGGGGAVTTPGSGGGFRIPPGGGGKGSPPPPSLPVHG